MRNNKVFGDSLIPDCPRNGGFCNIHNKCALTNSIFTSGLAIHAVTSTSRPLHKIQSGSLFTGKTIIRDNEFINYPTKTSEGR